MTYYCDHNICPIESTLPVVSDTVIVNKEIHFDQISSICNIDKEELRSLNPQYKRDIIPGNTKPYALRLPHYTIPTYIENQDSIYNYKRDEYFTNRKKVEAKQKPKVPTSRTTYYKIKNGDTLSTIARKHGVSVSKLKQWNGLKNNNIRAGKTLKIIK